MPFSTRWNLPAIPEALPVPAHTCMRSILPCKWPEVPAGCTGGRFWEQFAEPSGTSWGWERNREKGLLKGHQAAFFVLKGAELPLGLAFLQGTGHSHKCPLPAGVSTDSELCPSWGGMGHWAREGRSSCRRKYPWLTPQTSREQQVLVNSDGVRAYRCKSQRKSNWSKPSLLQDQHRTTSTTSISRWGITGSGSLLSGTAKISYTFRLYRTAIEERSGKTLKKRRKISLA